MLENVGQMAADTSAVTMDSKYRVVLVKKIRRAAGIRGRERLVAVPFHGGVILATADGRRFAESLEGFEYREEEHEASSYLTGRTKDASP